MQWNEKEQEIAFLNTEIKYSDVFELYQDLFVNSETRRTVIFRVFAQKFADQATA